MGEVVELTFHLPFQTSYGENLYIVGNLPLFGNWDPRRARRMAYRHPSSWYLHLELRDQEKDSVLKYKYCILNDKEADGGIPRWEPGEEHKVELPKNGKLDFPDVWGLGKKVRNVPLPSGPGKIYISTLPFSPFDPFQTAYRELSAENIDIILLLCYQAEIIQQTGGQDLVKRYGKDGFAVIWFPIDDFGVPTDKALFLGMLTRIHSLLKKGCSIAVQCHAGIGRAGLAVACLVKTFYGKEVNEVVPWVREQIVGALQTKEQVDYVASFK